MDADRGEKCLLLVVPTTTSSCISDKLLGYDILYTIRIEVIDVQGVRV